MGTRSLDPEVEGFLALLATQRAPTTVDAYRRDLTALAAWLDGPLGRITTEQLEGYLAELRAAGLSPATIARRVAAICVHRLGCTTGGEQREKAFDLGIAFGRFHCARFRGEPRIACLPRSGRRDV